MNLNRSSASANWPCATAHAREIASILNLGRRPHLGRRHADRIGRLCADSERTGIRVGRLRLEARNLDLGLASMPAALESRRRLARMFEKKKARRRPHPGRESPGRRAWIQVPTGTGVRW